jgi:hypothetical protein
MKRLEEDSNEIRRRKLLEAETGDKHSTGISIDDTSNFDEEIGSYLSTTGPASPEILSLISAGKRLFYPKTVTTYPQKCTPCHNLTHNCTRKLSQLIRKNVPQNCQQASRKAFLLRSSSGSAAAGRKATALHPTSWVTQKSTLLYFTPKLSQLNPKMYPMSQLNSKMYPKMYPKTYPKTVTT